VAGILYCKTLALKNMPQMCIALSAEYFDSPTIGVNLAPHCPRYFIVKAGPTAV
jgi:hypothetical protein